MNRELETPLKEDILIVDDSPDNLRVLSSTLIEQGYTVRCVKSGSMALIGIQTSPPDLILLDIRMPIMNGYEVCQALKANGQTQYIPIIFLSALDDVTDKIKAFEVGGVDYITKPFRTEEVLARVKHQLVIQRLQKQLIMQNQQLQQEIRDRKQIETSLHQEIHKRSLIEAELQIAKELAEASNYAKSEFLARMSHELRTPLNAILGFTQLLERGLSNSAEQQDYLATIHRSGQHLLNLINNILTVASAEASKPPLHESCFDLYDLLENLSSFWQLRARAKGLRFSLERSQSLSRYVRSDENKLRQVLTSLLDNAVRFTQTGRVALQVRQGNVGVESQEPIQTESDGQPPSETGEANFQFTEKLQSSWLHLLFEVQDTGPGMAPEEVDQLFSVFYQTETGRQSEQGLGLSLPISRKFVQWMGGDLSLESRLGQGTTAQFYIRVQSVSADAVLTENLSTRSSFPFANEPQPVHLSTQFVPLSKGSENLTSELLKTLMSAEWIALLHQAAIRGFDQPILQLIQEIPPTHLFIAEILTDWTHNFQFDQILALTQPVVD
ncbi:MAG: response regulator [Scytolyngbya sp. HA4215-MV1]|jgi:signal transduction histidine kinase|nr:response regulator [Scytolyngbya sp. HA4215-MV1]